MCTNCSLASLERKMYSFAQLQLIVNEISAGYEVSTINEVFSIFGGRQTDYAECLIRQWKFLRKNARKMQMLKSESFRGIWLRCRGFLNRSMEDFGCLGCNNFANLDICSSNNLVYKNYKPRDNRVIRSRMIVADFLAQEIKSQGLDPLEIFFYSHDGEMFSISRCIDLDEFKTGIETAVQCHNLFLQVLNDNKSV